MVTEVVAVLAGVYGTTDGKTRSLCLPWNRRVYMSLGRRPSLWCQEMEWRTKLAVVERREGKAVWK